MTTGRLALAGAVALCVLALMAVCTVAGPAEMAAPAQAGSWTVCPAGPPACDYATIQAAVDAAEDGDVVKVAEGVYTGVLSRPVPSGYVYPPSSGEIAQVVYVDKTLTLQGGYTSPGFAEPPDPEGNPSVIDAQGQGRALVVWGEISPTIQGLSLVHGSAADQGGHNYDVASLDVGGNAYVASTAFTLTHSHISEGMAEYGGGLYVTNCEAGLVQESRFTNNNATWYGVGHGGGLFALESTLVISGNTMANNHSGSGAGAFLYRSQFTLADNVIAENEAEYRGAIFVIFGEGTISRNDISSNHAGTYGGGILLDNSSPLIVGNVISANVAANNGGGLHSLGGENMVLRENRFVDNSAQGGSAAWFQWLSVELTNNWITSKETSGYTSLHFNGVQAALRHTTIVGQGEGSHSGVHVTGSGLEPSDVSLTDTILVGWDEGIYASGDSTVLLEGTLWGSGLWANGTDWAGSTPVSTGTVNVWADPDFVNAAMGDYHLGSRSAAIDAGVDAGVPTDIDGDQRPRGCAADIGADEYPGLPFLDLHLLDGVEGSGIVTVTVGWNAPAPVLTYTLRTAPASIDDDNWFSAMVLTDSLPGSAQNYVAAVPFDGSRIYLAAKYSACGELSSVSSNVAWPPWRVYLPVVAQQSP